MPLTLLLICMAVVPVVTLTVSQYAGILPAMLVRGMALAVIFTWIGFAIWPLPPMKDPDPPLRQAICARRTDGNGHRYAARADLSVVRLGRHSGTADDGPHSRQDGAGARVGQRLGKLLGNFVEGFVAVAAFYLLKVAPSLASLALITFVIGVGFAQQIAKGSVRGDIAARL